MLPSTVLFALGFYFFDPLHGLLASFLLEYSAAGSEIAWMILISTQTLLALSAIFFAVRMISKMMPSSKVFESKRLNMGAARLHQMTDVNAAVRFIVGQFYRHWGFSHVCAFVWSDAVKGYSLEAMRGYPRGQTRLFKELDKKHPVRLWLESEKVILERDSLAKQYLSEVRKKGSKLQDPSVVHLRRILDFLDAFQATTIVPGLLEGRLMSFLVLSAPKLGKRIKASDKKLLLSVAADAVKQIESVRLNRQLAQQKRELTKLNAKIIEKTLELTELHDLSPSQTQMLHEQKMAVLGRLAASVGHEVNNPLTILSMNVSRLILKYRKDPDLKMSEVEDFFYKMESNIQRIKAVVNTLTGLLRKSENGKFESLSIKQIIQKTLPLVRYQTYLDNLSGTEVLLEIPADLPRIDADLERLQEVFLNLFTNAYQALAGRASRRIFISATLVGGSHPEIALEFTDNGNGMSEDDTRKIFQYGYTTKKAGSGIGLYMCRYIMELHGGAISVASEIGVGTTFHLRFPLKSTIQPRISESSSRRRPQMAFATS